MHVPVGDGGGDQRVGAEDKVMTPDLYAAAWVCSSLALLVGVMLIVWWKIDNNDKLKRG